MNGKFKPSKGGETALTFGMSNAKIYMLDGEDEAEESRRQQMATHGASARYPPS